MNAAISLSDILRIGSLYDLPHNEQSTNAIHDSGNGYALMGTLRVADRNEKLSTAPFNLPAGSIVFCEKAAVTSLNTPPSMQIRCQAPDPRLSWFTEDILVLLTHWRYVQPPTLLHGDSAIAWAYIEILSAPVILPKTIRMPHVERPLSWWLKHQIHPELDLEQAFFTTIKELPPLSGAKAALLLAQQPRKKHKTKRSASAGVLVATEHHVSSVSLMGRVHAKSSISPDINGGDSGFMIELAVDSMLVDGAHASESIPIVLYGTRFLALFVSLCVEDSLFITELNPAFFGEIGQGKQAVYVATATSQAFRIDEFDGLEESQICIPAVSLASFNQQSQQSLLTQITDTATNSAELLSGTGLSSSTGTQSEHPSANSNNQHLIVHGGKLESYIGEVTKVLDAMLGVYVIDNSHLVVLTFWPMLSPLFILRPGTRISLDNMHVALLSNSKSYHWNWIDQAFSIQNRDSTADERRVLVFGACSRSSVRIIDFPELHSPASYASTVNMNLAPTIVKRARGFVQMIQVIEAYWVLRRKFLADQDTFLSGQAGNNIRNDFLNKHAFERRAMQEFIDHNSTCGSSLAKSSIALVVTLRDVARRFVSLRKRQERDYDDEDSGELAFLTIYPSELQLEGIPLIGQLAVNERGYVCLRDKTAELCVRADAVVTNDQCSGDGPDRPLFSGQNMIGHVCAWHNWSFAIENIKLNSESTDIDDSKNTKQFSQVHVYISKPEVLYVDSTFGGVARHTLDSTSYAFIVHSQGPAMPRLKSENGQSFWRAEIFVKGARIKIGSDQLLHQLHSNVYDPPLQLHMDSNCIEFISLVYCPAELPVQFVSGKAYIICTPQPSEDQRTEVISTGGYSVCRLSKHEHVHPVHLALNDHTIAEPASSKVRDIAKHIPTVHIDADRDTFGRQIQLPTIYSVSDLFASHADGQESNLRNGSKSACIPEGILSVCGTIESRKVAKSVVFAADKMSSEDPDVTAHLCVGQLETHISLHDPDDSTIKVVLYAKLNSYSHPLWLVPGTKVICRNVVFNVSKHSRNPYLSGTAATSIEEVVSSYPNNASIWDVDMLADSAFVHMCIGEMYTIKQTCKVRLVCQIKSVESFKAVLTCLVCKRPICNMSCGCAQKQHRLLANGPESTPATAHVDAELLCLVSDGSGMAWLTVSSTADILNVLCLTAGELEEIFDKAAQSASGQLQWKPPRRVWDQPARLESAMDYAAAAAASGAADMIVEGVVVRDGSVSIKQQQQLRLDGHDYTIDKMREPRILALQGGKRFEVACYKNKVTEWRTGVEKDIDEVLQIHQVYMNVSKGEVAKTDVLLKCFKTDDVDKVINEILMKGEQQVSDKERHHQLDNMFRDIATVVVEMCINPKTQQQYTVTMIEKAMSDIHYSVNTNRSAKQQALDVIRQLQEQGAIPIARAQMRVRIVLSAKDGKRLKPSIEELISKMEDEERGEEHEYICLIEPGKYRVLTDLVGKETKGAGEVAILNFMDLKESDNSQM
ncbi:hypothetical protein EV183_001966 [Coemansia sp. RSA 2336]|nr:hypothetical protein EV183_001966 [Coemansia sp. RSA 2336]